MSDGLLEVKRLEELFRYFLAAREATGFEKVDVDSAKDYAELEAHISADPVLNGLCQLGPLRLDCDRAFVSLVDHEYQYVAAEMTRAGSVIENTRSHPGLPVCIGAKVLDLTAGVCAGTMPAFLSDGKAISTPNIYADKTRYVIKDFTQDEMYRDRPYVAGYPHMRWYAEVPIRTASGFVIGSYAVVDNKPRGDLTHEQYLILADTALAIMRHLETLKTESDHVRASSLLHGLDAFVRKNKGSNRPTISNSTFAVSPSGSAQPEYVQEQDTGERSDGSADSSSSFPPSHSPSDVNGSIQVKLPPTRLTLLDRIPLDLATRYQHSVRSDGRPRATEDPLAAVPPYNEQVLKEGGNFVPSQFPSTLRTFKDTLAYAAGVLREAMDLDGVTFLDASYRGFGSRSQPDWIEENISNFERRFQTSSSDSPALSESDFFSGLFPDPVLAPCLGTSVKADMVAKGPFSLPHAVHQSLIRHFPVGRIFVLSEDLSTTKMNLRMSLEKDSTIDSSKQHQLRRKYLVLAIVEEALRSYFPGAKSVIFFPLWDPYKSTWFAGGIGWSRQPRRRFEREDFSYFSVFGNSVMSEIARLELIASDRAMSDFISSVSHELRSPLHGILGSAELLSEIISGDDQQHFISIIENCGRMLLQTLDQILDYSKINSVIPTCRSQNTSSSERRLSSLNKSVGEKADVNLTTLVEETVQSLLLGYQYKKFPKRRDRSGVLSTNINSTGVNGHRLRVIVDLEKSAHVIANVNTAAWQRIVLNVVGNSLKYTTSGHIKISLEITGDDNSDNGCNAVFRVKDTGRGIDEDYLRTHIFTPFIQENTLTEGTGLGMSIVKSMIDSLKGHIHVGSKIGQGTEVSISMPLQNDIVTTTLPLPEYPGVNVAMLVTNQGMASLNSLPAASRTIQECLAKTIKSWYGITLTETTETTGITAEVVIVDESDLLSLSQRHGSQNAALTISGNCTFIVVCTQHDVRDQHKHTQSDRILYLTSPYGPHQIGTVLKTAIAQNNSTTVTLNVDTSSAPKIVLRSRQESDAETEVSQSHDLSRRDFEAPTSPQTSNADAEASKLSFSPVSSLTPRDGGSRNSSFCTPTSRILLVDDNSINLNILECALRKLGYDFDTAVNGLEAVNKFKEAYSSSDSQPFGWVFMDISMPVMDGFEATREIRNFERVLQIPQQESQDENDTAPEPEAMSPLTPLLSPSLSSPSSSPVMDKVTASAATLRATRIIAMTGLGSAEAQEEALTSGMNQFLMKPVSMKTIKSLLMGNTKS